MDLQKRDSGIMRGKAGVAGEGRPTALRCNLLLQVQQKIAKHPEDARLESVGIGSYLDLI